MLSTVGSSNSIGSQFHGLVVITAALYSDRYKWLSGLGQPVHNFCALSLLLGLRMKYPSRKKADWGEDRVSLISDSNHWREFAVIDPGAQTA